MKYRRKLIRYGAQAEVYIYPVFEKARGRRSKKRKPSRECQQALNNKRRERRLAREIGFNFGKGDIFLTLTYDDQHNPGSYERAEKDIKNYLAKIKREAARSGAVLKYIYVTEKGSISGRWHHHLIITGCVSYQTFNDKWGMGYISSSWLRPSPDAYKHLAKYCCKGYYEQDDEPEDEDEQSRAVSCMKAGRLHRSRNIAQPTEVENDFEISRRKAARIAGEALEINDAGEVIPMLKGYTITGCESFYNDANGGYYLALTLYNFFDSGG